MKKFIYLCVMACSLGFITSCSSDNNSNDVIDGGGKEQTTCIWDKYKGGTYTIWGEDFSTTDSVSYKVLSMSMQVKKKTDTTAEITFVDEDEFYAIDLPSATIEEKNGYTFTGKGTLIPSEESKQESVSVDITVNITTDEKVTVEIKSGNKTIKATNDALPKYYKLMSTWRLEDTKWYDAEGKEVKAGDANAVYPSGSCFINWETDGTPMTWIDGDQIDPSTVALMSQRMANQYLPSVLRSITLKNDGKVIIEFRKLGTDKWQNFDGYATYEVKSDKQILVKLNVDNITANMENEKQEQAVTAILNSFKDGILVNYELSEKDYELKLYIDKDFATTVANNTVLKGLVESIKDTDMNGMGALIKALCSQIPGLMEHTTKFQAGLNLVY